MMSGLDSYFKAYLYVDSKIVIVASIADLVLYMVCTNGVFYE